MCDYCEGKKDLDTDCIEARINPSKNIIEGEYNAYSCDSSFDGEILEINFCPMCGEKLRSEENFII